MKDYFFAVISLTFLSFSVTAQEKRMAWDYPVKPGTEQWKTFTTSSL
jgi:carbonic anhydrase